MKLKSIHTLSAALFILSAFVGVGALAATVTKPALGKPTLDTLRSQGQAAATARLPDMKSKSDVARARFQQIKTVARPQAKGTLPPPPAPGQLTPVKAVGGTPS